MRQTGVLLLLGVAALFGCGDDALSELLDLPPEHCRLPTVDELDRVNAEDGEWWKPGPLPVATTIPWPECPSLKESTASSEDGTRITYPDAEGQFGVIVFAHANNSKVCNPTDRYRTLHEQWASWGWVVVAADASELNCRPWSVASMAARATTLEIALDEVRRENGDPRSPLFGRIDFSRAVAAGHSRGGAVAVAVARRGGWAGAITIAGGTPPRYGLGEDLVEVPVLGITAELDTDVELPKADLTEELLRGRYSWHTMRRASHPYTADGFAMRRFDDPDEILPRIAQLELTKFLTTAYLASEHGVWDDGRLRRQPNAEVVLYDHHGADFARAFLRGSGYVSRWNVPSDETVWIDRFESRAAWEELPEGADEDLLADPLRNDLGLPNACVEGSCREVWTYDADRDSVSARGFNLASSLLIDGVWRTEVDREVDGGWLRARVRTDVPGTAFDVVLEQATGESVTVATDAIGSHALGDRFVQLEVPVRAGHLRAVRFEVRAGEVNVDDLRLQ